MIEQVTRWGYLEPGMYLRAGDGSTWRVDGKRRGANDGWELRIRNQAGQTSDVERGFDDDVTLLVPTHEEAESLIAAMLPVSGVRRKIVRMEEIATNPDSKWVRAALAAHLHNLHHVSISPTAHAENKSIADLVESHNLSHARPEPDWIAHVHVPSGDL